MLMLMRFFRFVLSGGYFFSFLFAREKQKEYEFANEEIEDICGPFILQYVYITILFITLIYAQCGVAAGGYRPTKKIVTAMICVPTCARVIGWLVEIQHRYLSG